MNKTELEIVIGKEVPDLVRFAAGELQRYVERLFNMRAVICACAGNAENVVFLDPASANMDAPVEDEAFILKRFQKDSKRALAAFGGSPAATMWAIYELVEQWGVRYLLRGDVFPTGSEPFHLPEIDMVYRPDLRIRGLRLINLFSMGLESWALADLKRYIDQLAKLKFNSIFHQLWCWQPYVHYECRGISKTTGTHWFGWHYPIDENTIGRHHFHGTGEFVPPDFEGCRTYEERIRAGETLVHGTLSHAKRRGMQTQIATVLTDFSPEFSHLLGMPPTAPHGFGFALSGGHLGAYHEGFQDLCAAALRAYIDTYPEADRYIVNMPEFQAPGVPFEDAWKRLDEKYAFSSIRTLEDVLGQTRTRTDYPGGPDRVEATVKGEIVALDLFDRLLHEQKILEDCSKPNAAVFFNGVAEELTEVYNLMFPGVIFPCGLDYTASRVAKRPHAFERIKKAGLKPLLTVTTQDDNIGVVPQLATESIHQVLSFLRRYEWEGFNLRYWMICDMEPVVAYLSKASWNESVTPEIAYRDHIRSICSERAEDELVKCLEILDRVTIGLGDHGLGIGFPVPDMAIRHWQSAGALPEELKRDRNELQRALDHARTGRQKALKGHDYLDYLVGRLEFGIEYIDLVEMLKKAGEMNKRGNNSDALNYLEKSVAQARKVVGIHSRIARPGTDLGALAQLNEDLYRRLCRFLCAARGGKRWVFKGSGDSGTVLVDS